MSLKIEKETARQIYHESPELLQKMMVEEFGAECFKKIRYDDIKTFDDACRAMGTTEQEFNDRFEKLGLSNDTLFYEKLKIVVKAINDGWTPDWSNINQYKYYPYFEVLGSGVGFSDSGYYYAGTLTSVGSRLCFESLEKAKYAGIQFIEIYKNYLL
jgi:hypothetical protein